MVDDFNFKEWGISDKLPGAFVSWLNDYINENPSKHKVYPTIASELSVNAGHLGRWLVGLGPLTKSDIISLVNKFGPGIYTLLWIKRPDNL